MLHNLQYDSSPIALNYIEEKFKAVSKMLPKSKNSLNVELKWMQYKDAMKNTLSEVLDHIITRLEMVIWKIQIKFVSTKFYRFNH